MANSVVRQGFSLLDQPWIPVLDLNGDSREVSLLELYDRAGEIRMIACDLPSQTFAILRLLLAILHRATGGPPGEAAWRDLWRAQKLPQQDISDYLEEFRDRFDLLHREHPFYQVAGLRTAKNDTFGLERLICDVPNGHQFLTVRAGVGMERISPAEAARWVVHCQAYDPSGIKSGAVGDPRVQGGRGYPIGVGSVGALGGVYLEGATLRETLLLNLVPIDEGLLSADGRDLPVWERPPLGPAEEPAETRGPFGVAGLYTWQSRRILLRGDVDGITGAMVANGDKISWQDRQRQEPLSIWGRSGPQERKLKVVPVYLPRPHDHTRALWRGLETVLPQPSSSGGEPSQRLAPLVMHWLARLRVKNVIDAGFQVTSRAVSVAYGTQAAVVDEVFADALTMNVQVVLAESALRSTVVDAAAAAERAVEALRSLAADLVRATAGSGTDNGERQHIAGIAYAQLDQRFRAWLSSLRPDTDPVAAQREWQDAVRKIAARLGRDAIVQAGPAAWAGRVEKDTHYCSSQAEAWFRSRLAKALPVTSSVRSMKQEVPV